MTPITTEEKLFIFLKKSRHSRVYRTGVEVKRNVTLLHQSSWRGDSDGAEIINRVHILKYSVICTGGTTQSGNTP